MRCVQGLSLWRNSSIDVSHEILKGYQKGNHEEVINEVAAGNYYSTLYISFVCVFSQYIEGTKTIRPLTYTWFVPVFTYAISGSFSIFLSVSFISI